LAVSAPSQAIQKAQRKVADEMLRRCTEVEVVDLPVGYSLSHANATIPSLMVRWAVLSVLFQLDSARKWQATFNGRYLPDECLDWLGVRSLEALAACCRIDWMERGLFAKTLSEEVGRLLIELAQPRTSASIRQTIRQLFLRKATVDEKGGVVLHGKFWRCFLRQTEKPLSIKLKEELCHRIDFTLGQFDLAEAVPRRYRPLPELDEEQKRVLEAAVVDEPPERLKALEETFECGLFDFIPDLFATTYSLHGRRPYHPLLCFKVCLAMMVMGQTNPEEFYRRINDSLHLRLFLQVFRADELPTPRRIKAFLEEKLAPAIEFIVLWFNLKVLEEGSIEMGDEFGTDGMEMHAQARMKSDAAGLHLAPAIAGMLAVLQPFLKQQGRDSLTEDEQKELLEALRQLKWSELGNADKSKSAILDAVRNALEGHFVTPVKPRSPPASAEPEGAAAATFRELVQQLAGQFEQAIKAFGDKFGWSTLYDTQCGARTKYGKTVHGYSLQFLTDLKYGLVWSFAVFPAGQSYQPHIAAYVIDFQDTYGLGPIKLTSDKEFTNGDALHQWHQCEQPIHQYGPRANIPAESLGIFTEKDFKVYDDYAICPAGKILKCKPGVAERGSNKQHRYQAKKTDCEVCRLRPKCTKGKGQKILCVHIYRDDLNQQAERMKADPEKTRNLMGRHRAIVEGNVNNLKTHQAARFANWKGHAMANLQLGLAILLANALKWRKVKTGQLQPVKLKPREEAKKAS